MTFTLSNKQARHLVLHLQGLSLAPQRKLTAPALYDLIHQLGYVQVDSIQWLERAHHMILFARNQTYRPLDLKHMIEKQHLLFEGWTHDASIIPCAFYPYWRHRHQRQQARLRDRFVKWQGPEFLDQCDDLLELIAARGAIRSRDLERPAHTASRKMWQWHAGKAALEYLWRTGRLAITGRDGFQKVYDLSRRVIDAKHLSARCDHDAFVDWACSAALVRLGFGTPADIARYWDLLSIQEVKDWLARQNGRSVRRVLVKSADNSAPREMYARADIENLVMNLPGLPARLRALSPFDPVIRDRNRLQWLFGFDYRIEIYVPQAERKFGYYVFPLLDKDRLVGRIDMRARRRDNLLQVSKVWWERGGKLSRARGDRLSSELARQARLAGVRHIEWLLGPGRCAAE